MFWNVQFSIFLSSIQNHKLKENDLVLAQVQDIPVRLHQQQMTSLLRDNGIFRTFTKTDSNLLLQNHNQ